MAIKKSDLYSSLWASCDELRGGMDASQYKDYVLSMLFIKYVTDKYGNSNDFAPPVTLPKGASFKDRGRAHSASKDCRVVLARKIDEAGYCRRLAAGRCGFNLRDRPNYHRPGVVVGHFHAPR
jgi:hypothetical protein